MQRIALIAKAVTRDLALDHEDMSILALRCRVDYHRAMFVC